ncbi:DUF5320 domain-containing protein [Thermodesulfovibrio sp.]|uniref:DUF5320 domain-containing protein n=1 Tax=Thermodesulfovibrio sp. TaxID=2067987 RepID=UPI0030A3723A
MPGFDRTGPFGQGPMTGRGMGYCGGASRYMNSASGIRFGFGRGFRCLGGFRRRFRWLWRMPFFGGVSSREEVEWLKEEAEILKRELEAVQRRLSEIEKEKTE